MAASILHVLHRQVWQRLPYRMRRAAFFRLMKTVAPRPSLEAKPSSPVIVAGAFRSASGLGQSARLSYEALDREGFAVLGIDLTSSLRQPLDLPEFPHRDGRATTGSGTLILHVNAPLVPLALWSIGRPVVTSKHVVGYWAWELPRVPDEWTYGVPFVHEIWVPSSFVADALKPIAGGRPMYVVPHPVAVRDPFGNMQRTGDGHPFTVLTMLNAASSIDRKNPHAAIAAFRRAFAGDMSAQLIVKTCNLGLWPSLRDRLHAAVEGEPNITIKDGVASDAEITSLFRQADVLLSLHRSEGFGLVLAEAMLAGVPVVATDWSGSRDFLSSETGFLVPYRLVAAGDIQRTYDFPSMTWAEADVAAAADRLRWIRDHPDDAQSVSFRARILAETRWSAAAYARTVGRILMLREEGGLER